MTEIFRYNKGIDRQIAAASSKVVGVTVKSVVKMSHGEVNHVYKIIAHEGVYLARIFRHKDWQEKGKLQWVEKQLTLHKIQHAKILYYSQSNKFFPHGFMVTEFLAGCNGNEAVKRKQISLSKAFFKTGQALKKVHQIKIKKFGKIRNGNGESSDFIEGKLKAVKQRIKRLETVNAVKPQLYPIIESLVKNNLCQFSKHFTPVLNHGDANRENAIYIPKGDWVLVDWDNAYAGIWLEDYAELTYWVDWERKSDHAKRVYTLIHKNFFKGYDAHNFTDGQIVKIERVLHIIKTTNMMVYYYFVKKTPSEFKKTRKKLYNLIGVL